MPLPTAALAILLASITAASPLTPRSNRFSVSAQAACQVSPTARKDCGYYGINQAQCEAQACCWVPSDVQGAPWCFFDDSPAPSPAPPADESPAPAPSASPASVPGKCGVSESTRFDCGYTGINQNQCEANGCCWVPATTPGSPWCFYQEGVTPPANPPSPPSQGDCSTYNGRDSCQGSQTVYPEAEYGPRRWQTPPRGDVNYVSSFKDYHAIQGYARVQYDSSLRKATVTVLVDVRDKTCVSSLRYSYDGQVSVENTLVVDSNEFGSGRQLKIKVTGTNCSPDLKGQVTLDLDPIAFVWNNPVVQQDSRYEGGQKGAIVELFGWPWKDVEKECVMLGKAGYMGVKVWPPNEAVITDYWLQEGELNPWYFVYQPVSYRLESRMGTRDELVRMIQTCRKNNVRVYADAVVNHMSGGGNDVQFHRNQNGGSCVTWGPKNATAGSPYYTHAFTYGLNPYTNDRAAQEFPAVPYGPTDFHCDRALNSYTDGFVLNYGWLVGLTDLDTGKDYVRRRIADYFTDLLGVGFSGFRIDAAKHIRPDDLAAILNILRVNMGGKLPDDFMTYLEVIMGGEKDLLACQDNDYNYYTSFDQKMRAAGLSESDISKVKIWSSDYPKEHPICGYWRIPASRFAIGNDDHDQQNPGSSSREMAGQGSVLIKDRDVGKHRYFETLLFDRRDDINAGQQWKIKLVLSSYSFMDNGAAGFPDGLSDCKIYKGLPGSTCKSVPFDPAYVENACGYSVVDSSGRWQQGKYTRVHRDRSIILAMRRWMGLGDNVSNEQIGLPGNCN